MMKVMMIVGVAVSALAPATVLADDAPAGTINLMCAGSSLKDETVGDAFDLLAGKGRTERIGTADSISITINPDDTGSARLPRRLLTPYRKPNPDGSFPIVKLARSANEITGQVRIHAGYKMPLRLDRLTGIVTLTGLSSFSGRCDAYDPANVVRKF